MFVACNDADAPAGILCFELVTATGEMRLVGETHGIGPCLYLARHPTMPILYATGTREHEAVIQAFRVDQDGSLTWIGQQPTNGLEPCYVSVTPDGRHALVVNYTGPQKAGSIVVFPLGADGSIQPMSAHVQLNGKSVHRRQDASHPHMIVPTPDGRFVLVPDLGTDRLMIYRIVPQTGQLEPHTQPYLEVQTGSGPRHLDFHPHRQVFFLMSELKPVLTAISYDDAGNFKIVDTVMTLPPESEIPVNLGADVHVAPSGRFVYVSNRGHNSLSGFAIDPVTNALVYVGHQSTLGDWPRGFALDPDGQVLVVANQRTNDLHTFTVDPDTGRLTATDHHIAAAAPVCVVFMG
ncbi:MAG: lactonase family protein [Chloroflexi bacterium]|nr:lactonase family protein [Chloroflexota bacterium]